MAMQCIFPIYFRENILCAVAARQTLPFKWSLEPWQLERCCSLFSIRRHSRQKRSTHWQWKDISRIMGTRDVTLNEWALLLFLWKATGKYRAPKIINVTMPAIVLLNPGAEGALSSPSTAQEERDTEYWKERAMFYSTRKIADEDEQEEKVVLLACL